VVTVLKGVEAVAGPLLGVREVSRGWMWEGSSESMRGFFDFALGVVVESPLVGLSGAAASDCRFRFFSAFLSFEERSLRAEPTAANILSFLFSFLFCFFLLQYRLYQRSLFPVVVSCAIGYDSMK